MENMFGSFLWKLENTNNNLEFIKINIYFKNYISDIETKTMCLHGCQNWF